MFKGAQLFMHGAAFRTILRLVELGLVPDIVTRCGIRYLLSIRLQEVRLKTYDVPCRTLVILLESNT
jgi:hypothetical protein